MKHVKLFEQFINEAKGQFDSATHKKILKAIDSTRTYMEVETFFGEEDNMSEIMIATRKNGNVGSETPGQADIKEAERVQKIIMKKFPGVKAYVETAGEWVHLLIEAPNKL